MSEPMYEKQLLSYLKASGLGHVAELKRAVYKPGNQGAIHIEQWGNRLRCLLECIYTPTTGQEGE